MNVGVVIEAVLLGLAVITALAATIVRSLLAASMLLGIFSLLVASTWIVLHAPDVAFTEAAVGAGLTTVLLLAALVRTGWREQPHAVQRRLFGGVVSGLVAVFLVLGLGALPDVRDPASPAAVHVGAHYLERSYEETHVVNVVTAVLAGYRGYDTMFETVVVFTGGAGVLLLLLAERGRRRRRRTT